ncbi:hypothetical protein FRB94_012655 [Tulasnella sp. JGI-2019a]|nr:hypothetical protein FRB93_001521 [Tulasnella sp. JGI-2019a]KAG9009018.1 hypothetical protein FRB94_012655 [Tulasnella sp. JGI-2019a]KAG9036005.1 hypothetical protein FRB95_010005 [Tulasnella sp. JGI-2019a]
MIPQWMSTVASVGMAIGPPLVYADQAISIIKRKDSKGFSQDVCAILLIANIMRCFFWLGDRFELALLIQSLCMILAQLGLLFICVKYRPKASPESLGGPSSRPFGFWQWTYYAPYLEFLAALILVLTIAVLIFGRMEWFVWGLGFVALGLESTLPLPQLYSNYNNKTLYGFETITLMGWVGGDAYKTVYFFILHSPLQFKVCGAFQLATDLVIVGQRIVYGNAEPLYTQVDNDLEEALRLAEE